MKTLPTEFYSRGFHFKQLERLGNVALFRKRRAHWSPGLFNYETIKVQSHNERIIAGVTIPASEGFPSSEQWGVLGFTDCDLSHARARFAALIPPKR